MVSVSIVIPAWNEEKVIEETVSNLTALEYDKDQCEVIVVAGGHDRTLEVSKRLERFMHDFSRYVVIEQEPLGKNAAIQKGLLEAQGEIFVLLDADTIMTGDSLDRLVEPLVQGTAELATANAVPVKRTWVTEYYSIIKAYFFDSITIQPGNAIALKAKCVREKLDLFFDTNVQVGVDYYLSKMFLEKGLRVVFAKGAHVKTCLPSSIRFFWLTELRWLSSFIEINGFHIKTFGIHCCVVLALLCTIPFSKWSFIGAVMVHAFFLYKKGRMFWAVLGEVKTEWKYLPGFILLSYTHHIIGTISGLRHLSGKNRELYLYQGERG